MWYLIFFGVIVLISLLFGLYYYRKEDIKKWWCKIKSWPPEVSTGFEKDRKDSRSEKKPKVSIENCAIVSTIKDNKGPAFEFNKFQSAIFKNNVSVGYPTVLKAKNVKDSDISENISIR